MEVSAEPGPKVEGQEEKEMGVVRMWSEPWKPLHSCFISHKPVVFMLVHQDPQKFSLKLEG